VRTALLGLIMPAGEDPILDREIFLKILSMDNQGLWCRKNKSIPPKVLYNSLTSDEKKKYFNKDTLDYCDDLSRGDKEELQ
jgi:hypothetical protein